MATDPADFPILNDSYGEWWRGGDDDSNGFQIRNRPGVRVVLVLTKAAKQLHFPTAYVGEPVADWATIRQRLGSNVLTKSAVLKIDITNYVTDLSWGSSEEDKYVQASVTLDNTHRVFSGIPAGTQIVIERRKPIWSAKGKFYPMLATYIWEREKTMEGGSERLNLTCYDRMYWLSQYEVPGKVYKKDKAHKHGWTARQIILDLAKRAKIPLGEIGIKGGPPFKRFESSGSFLESVTSVLAKHKTKTGRKTKAIIHTRDGKLNIVMVKAPDKVVSKAKQLPYFNDMYGLEGGAVRETRKEQFATRLLLKASAVDTKKNKKKRKHKVIKQKVVTVNPSDPNVQKVFGIIEREDTTLRKKDVTLAQLKKLGVAKLDGLIAPDTEIEFKTRGYPNLWPGNFVILDSKRLGVKGVFRIYRVDYTLANGQLLMTLIVKGTSRVKKAYKTFDVPSSTERMRY